MRKSGETERNGKEMTAIARERIYIFTRYWLFVSQQVVVVVVVVTIKTKNKNKKQRNCINE